MAYWLFFVRRRRFRTSRTGTALYAAFVAEFVVADGYELLRKAKSSVSSILGDAELLSRLIQQKWNKLKDLGKEGDRFVTPIPPEDYEDMSLRIASGRLILAVVLVAEVALADLAADVEPLLDLPHSGLGLARGPGCGV